ncbi:Os12g0172400, partial [Oryza sativa Japonica Group]
IARPHPHASRQVLSADSSSSVRAGRRLSLLGRHVRRPVVPQLGDARALHLPRGRRQGVPRRRHQGVRPHLSGESLPRRLPPLQSTVIPFDNQLCWIDYMRGILFYDPAAIVVSFLPFPVDHETPRRNKECFWLYRGVSVLDASGVLKFIDVARDDGLGFESLRRDAGFTVTCYSLVLGEHKKKKKKHRRTMEWREDYKITSNELWSINSLDCLPRTLLMFPQVDIDRPHIVHFLAPELRYVIKKMWVVAIDMNTKIVESSSLYINGKEDLQTEDAGLTRAKSRFFPII